MRVSLEFLQIGKNHESVGVPLVLQFLGISYRHTCPHSAFSNFGEIPFKHSYQFMTLSASASGELVLDVMCRIRLSLQIWGWRFALQTQFFDRPKCRPTLIVVKVRVTTFRILIYQRWNWKSLYFRVLIFSFEFHKYLVCEVKSLFSFPTNYQLSNPSLSQWFMMLSLLC